MRLSVLAHAISLDLVQSLTASRLGGFAGVVLDPTAFPAIVDTSQTGRREIMHLLGREGLTLAGVEVRLSNAGFSPKADLDRELDRVSRAIDIARGLHGTLVLCDFGHLPAAPDEVAVPRAPIAPAALGRLILPDPPKAAPQPPSMPRDLAFEASLEAGLRELADRADRSGCLIAFRSSLGSFASLHRALKTIDCGYFGIDLDTYAILADAWSPDAIVSAFGGTILNLRARDGLRGAGGRVVPAEVGQGATDWPTLLSLCGEADFNGFVSLDTIELPDRAKSAVRSAEALRAILEPR